jgi:AmmeMemoRadiSam system protein A
MSSLGNREKQLLLEVARRAVTRAAEFHEALANLPSDETLQRPGGAFVTLRRRGGRLRGCIGQLPSKDPLVAVIAHCAKAAALEDPRFSPISPQELSQIEIEISVLSPLESIAPGQIEPGKHGLVVTRGTNRGVLLPQVAAEHHWSAGRFLEETCEKAGLERDAWKGAATHIEAFTAEVFSEPDFRSEDQSWRDEPPARTKTRYSSST